MFPLFSVAGLPRVAVLRRARKHSYPRGPATENQGNMMVHNFITVFFSSTYGFPYISPEIVNDPS